MLFLTNERENEAEITILRYQIQKGLGTRPGQYVTHSGHFIDLRTNCVLLQLVSLNVLFV